MGKYVYIYTGGGMPAESEREATMAKWQAFLGGFGSDLVDMGSPFGESRGGGSATGFSVVKAGSLDEAANKAKACPIYDKGGNVEVYETLEM